MSNNVTQQPVISKAWDWGYEDAREGKSEFTGYDFFAGERLQEYLEGHRAGQYVIKRLSGGSEAKYVPFSDPALNSVQPAEYRDDYIGV
jgi:hypothetical protein